MSTSLPYQGSVRGYDYVRVEHLGGEIHFTIRQPRKTLRHPACGLWEVHPHGTAERRFRTVPIGDDVPPVAGSGGGSEVQSTNRVRLEQLRCEP